MALGLVIDMHVHTRAHSACSEIHPEQLIRQAIKRGLDGLVITEHHYQWSEAEIARLKAQSGEPMFLVLAGFEYTSRQGDILIFGLAPELAAQWPPGVPADQVVQTVHEEGGLCIAAHPTRVGLGFDETILTTPFDAIEVASVNLRPHEQRLAAQLAQNAGLRPMAASDAHVLRDVGRYATEFDDAIQSMADFTRALRSGRFRPADRESRVKKTARGM